MKSFEEERLRAEYTPKAKTGLDEAIKLDRKAKRGPTILAFVLGTIGALVLGVGMCLAMQVIGSGTPAVVLGVIIGIVGIATVGANYPIYTRFLKAQKEKYGSAILLALKQDE